MIVEISVVLPVYNGAQYLASSIESVLTQSFKNFELIIVDDASTDDSLKIAEKYAAIDPRVRVLKNTKNKKLPESLNVGFASARGKYWTWTSHDNLYRRHALEKLVIALKKTPEAVLVAADYSIMNDKGDNITVERLAPSETLIARNCIGACFLYRASVARRAGAYAVNRFLVEDYDYWIRLKQFGEFLHIPEDLYLYRSHASSLSALRLGEIHRMDALLKVEYLPLFPNIDKETWLKTAIKVCRYHPSFFIKCIYFLKALGKNPEGLMKRAIKTVS